MTLTEYIAHLREDQGECVHLRHERLRIARELEAVKDRTRAMLTAERRRFRRLCKHVKCTGALPSFFDLEKVLDKEREQEEGRGHGRAKQEGQAAPSHQRQSEREDRIDPLWRER